MAGTGTRDRDEFIISLPKDIKDVEAWTGGLGINLPDGIYNLEIIRMSQKRDEALQAPVVMPTYRVLDGEFAGQEAMPDSLSLAESALGKFKGFMLAATNGKITEGQAFKAKSFLGRKLAAKVYHEEYPIGSKNFRMRYSGYTVYDPERASVVSATGSTEATAPVGVPDNGKGSVATLPAPTAEIKDF